MSDIGNHLESYGYEGWPDLQDDDRHDEEEAEDD